MTLLEQLESFHQFATDQLRGGGPPSDGDEPLTLDDLFSKWRLEHPTPRERDDVNTVIRQGLQDIAAGRGVDADEFNEQLRAKYQIPRA